MMLKFPELELASYAKIHSLEPTPPIAEGDGNVVTARIRTTHTRKLVRAILETGEEFLGTPVHPIWSVEEDDCVALEELDEGDLVLGQDGPMVVETIEHLESLEPVYNIEIFGHHVYLIGESGVLVHNAGPIPKKCLKVNPKRQQKKAQNQVGKLVCLVRGCLQ